MLMSAWSQKRSETTSYRFLHMYRFGEARSWARIANCSVSDPLINMKETGIPSCVVELIYTRIGPQLGNVGLHVRPLLSRWNAILLLSSWLSKVLTVCKRHWMCKGMSYCK